MMLLVLLNFLYLFKRNKWLLLVFAKFVLSEHTDEPINYRLPLEVKPFRYWLEIEPHFENKTFSGRVKIEVEAVQNASTITLHSNSLTMPSKDEIKVRHLENKTYLEIESVSTDQEIPQQFLVINLMTPLVVGRKYKIIIPKFVGQLTTASLGFYSAEYIDENGTNKTFATTHFQPCGARRAFPCFDEPALKARFNLKIRRPNNSYHSISNTPKNNELSSDLLDVFKETELMSTYLLAFVISEMTFSEVYERHRVLGMSRDISSGMHKFSLSASYKALNTMEHYTGEVYAFGKLDHVAIPKDYFSFTAMENIGLITYSETNLMIPRNASTAKKQSVLTTICHEIVHQWFGNLVSPEWWDYTWLNEGFANYLEHVLADQIDPFMDIAREMVVNSVQVAMNYDGCPVSRPMTYPATDPNYIINMFDIVSYSKAGSVIRMLEHSVTSPVFRRGLYYYLNDRKFQSANPSQLYEAIQRALDESTSATISKNISQFMTSWETQAGVPLVTVTRIYNTKVNNVILKQRRFLNKQVDGEIGNWIIPINFATASKPSFKITAPDVWLSTSEDIITVPHLTDKHWLIANKLQTGYYRVNYDLNNWNLIIKTLMSNHSQIDAVNRAQLLDDCAFLAKSGYIPEDVNIRLQKYLVNENDPIPLAVQQNTFRHMDSVMRNSKDYKHFQKHVLEIFIKTYERLTFEEKPIDTPKIKKLRANVLYWLCKAGHVDCKRRCLHKFRLWRTHGKEIPPDLQKPVLCGAMRIGNKDDFNFLLNRFIGTKIPYFEELYGSALVCVENKTLVESALEHTYNKKSASLIKLLLKTASESSTFGLNATLDFVPKHYGGERQSLRFEMADVIENLAMYAHADYDNQSLKQILSKTTTQDEVIKLEGMVNEHKLWTIKRRGQLVEALKKHGATYTEY